MRIPETLFVNEVRLGARAWGVVLGIVLLVVMAAPGLWSRLERFDTPPDYRVPYSLSKDYWLYARWLRQAGAGDKVFVLGDSVVWGEYVQPNGSWSHFLSQESGSPDRFVNAGLNGMFPLALEGLVHSYGQALSGRKVLLHCNVLWMSSPKADLQTQKEEKFNHSRLVPQFFPRIPCYRADAHERLGAVLEQHVPFLGWVNHLQDSYFDQKSILQWTLEDDGQAPPHYPQTYANPLRLITFKVPEAPAPDPQRGPQSPRHRPWTATASGPSHFEWVSLESSLQWAAMQRLIGLLQSRGAQLLVVLGPFNEHMIAEADRPAFTQLRAGIGAWLAANHVPAVLPAALPSELYADASHPLTDGYALLAKALYSDPVFRQWVGDHGRPRLAGSEAARPDTALRQVAQLSTAERALP